MHSTSAEDIYFQFNNTYPLPREIVENNNIIPEELQFNQSTKQSFYFIKNNNEIEIGNYIVAIKNEKIIGAVKYENEIYTTLPIMGNDGNWYSNNYIEENESINIKIWNPFNKFVSTIIPDKELLFQDLNLEFIESYNIVDLHANSTQLISTYPNPFNPIINIDFILNNISKVIIDIYDINGIFICNLENSIIDNGAHRYKWDASQYSSGVYLLKFKQNNKEITQIITLIK